MTSRKLRIGTRGSALALWQADRVRSLLSRHSVWVDIVVMKTSGDEDNKRPPAPNEAIKGLFTKELEEALLDGRIDAAIHSLKDVAAELPAGLVLGSYPEREDPRDAVVSNTGGGLDTLAPGARIGTSSLRRIAAIRSERPDLEVVPLRGNVPTRLFRVDRGEIDAAVLAFAGLRRLGLDRGAVPLDPTSFVPAPGQGALALEIRGDDTIAAGLVRLIDDSQVRVGVEAERAAMATLEGGCRVPLGAICLTREGRRILHVKVFSPDGRRLLGAEVEVDSRDPAASGVQAARQLLAAGAAELIRSDSSTGTATHS